MIPQHRPQRRQVAGNDRLYGRLEPCNIAGSPDCLGERGDIRPPIEAVLASHHQLRVAEAERGGVDLTDRPAAEAWIFPLEPPPRGVIAGLHRVEQRLGLALIRVERRDVGKPLDGAHVADATLKKRGAADTRKAQATDCDLSLVTCALCLDSIYGRGWANRAASIAVFGCTSVNSIVACM